MPGVLLVNRGSSSIPVCKSSPAVSFAYAVVMLSMLAVLATPTLLAEGGAVSDGPNPIIVGVSAFIIFTILVFIVTRLDQGDRRR